MGLFKKKSDEELRREREAKERNEQRKREYAEFKKLPKSEQRAFMDRRCNSQIKEEIRQTVEVRKELSCKVVKTTIIGTDSKKKTGSTFVRGAVGDFVAGPVGMFTGIATGKTVGYTKFLVSFADGHQAVEEVKDNSERFQELVRYMNI